MDLYILRHGIAEAREASTAMKDSERRLTGEGKRKMLRIAKGMMAMDLTFDAILTSPFRRAKESAEIVAGVLQLQKRLKVFPALAAGEKTRELVEALEEPLSTAEAVLLVGHEPDLSNLLSRLVTGGPDMSMTLKKGGLCKLALNSVRYGRCAALEWLLAPAQLARLR